MRSLEKGELSHIVRRRLWAKKARLISRLGLNCSSGRVDDFFKKAIEDRSFSVYFKKQERRFYFDYEDLGVIGDIYEKRFGGIERTIIRRADALCRKEYTFLNTNFSFKEKMNWHYDPKSNQNWPIIFFKDIPYTGPERTGDIKLPWELNRHQYLVLLGQAYYLSGNEKYAREVLSIINSWIDDNPPYIGINWISALEAAIRLISWVWAFHFIKSSDEVTDDFIRIFISSIVKQAEYVSVNLSVGRYANNHIIGEAASLVIVGMYFKEFIKADKWIKKGLFILEKEALKQIYPDGGGVEQAISYLRFNIEFFLSAFLLAMKNKMKIPSSIMNRLEKAFEFIMLTLMPDGKAPHFGDTDDARAIVLSRDEFWDFRGILALGAALFNRGDFKWVSGGPSAELIWFLGAEGLKTYENIETIKPEITSYFSPHSGYSVFRDNWSPDGNYLIFDCGPLGYGSGAHGHADALSIQLLAYGSDALVDPGTFAYNQDQEYRNYFRRTKAHNTVSVDGKDQAEISGRMTWAGIPTTVVKDYYFSDQIDMVSAENDGYNRLPSPVTHKRTVIFSKVPVYYLLIDHLKSSGPHQYALHFHFPPGTVLNDQEDVRASVSSNRNLFLAVRCSGPLSNEIKEGDLAPMGWYSKAYGHKIESPALSFLSDSNDSTFFYSLIVPYQDKEIVISRFDGDRVGESTHLIVECDGFNDIWLLNERAAQTTYGGVSFVGKTALLRRRLDGSLLFVYGSEAIRLQMEDKMYLDSERPVNGFVVEPSVA